MLYNDALLIEGVSIKKICMLELFLKDHVTLNTGALMLKIQFYNHRN